MCTAKTLIVDHYYRAVPDAMKKAFQQADQAFLLAGVVDKANRLQDV